MTNLNAPGNLAAHEAQLFTPFPTLESCTPAQKDALNRIRYIITDTDNTMISHSCAVVDPAGTPSANLVSALVNAYNHDIRIIACTGRNRAMIREDARMLGLYGWIGEMGGITCLCHDPHNNMRETWHYTCADMPYSPSCGITPHECIRNSGAIDALLNEFSGDLEYYNDNMVGYQYREVTVALRGNVSNAKAQELLDSFALPLDWIDNGIAGTVDPRYTTLTCPIADPAHPIYTYHVAPRGLSKGSSVRACMEQLGASKDEVLCCGDSPADCSMAGVSDAFMLMQNGASNPDCIARLAAAASSRTLYLSHGIACDGFAHMLNTLCALR